MSISLSFAEKNFCHTWMYISLHKKQWANKGRHTCTEAWYQSKIRIQETKKLIKQQQQQQQTSSSKIDCVCMKLSDIK